MHNLRDEPGEITSAAGGVTTHHTQVGSITFVVDNQSVTLTNVAYVPSFHVNLMSVPRLTSYGATVSLSKDGGTLIHQKNDIKILFQREGDLYILTPSHVFRDSFTAKESPSQITIRSSASLQQSDEKNVIRAQQLKQQLIHTHNIYGHVSYDKILKIASSRDVTGLVFSAPDLAIIKTLSCRMHRLPQGQDAPQSSHWHHRLSYYFYHGSLAH
jgi:hypothetical protein